MCFDDGAQPPIPVSEGSGSHGERRRFISTDGAQFAGYLASPADSPKADVIILPDIRGLHRFYEQLALRFAENGFRAVAIDYFGRTAADDQRDEPFEFMPHVLHMTPDTFEFDFNATFAFLRDSQADTVPVFSVGFCMGGSLSYFAGRFREGLAGAVGFYAGLNRRRGAVTPVVDFAAGIQCPVLGLFGGADEGIPLEDIDRFKAALDEGRVDHEVLVYPDAPHSFFDRRATDFATESADAWNRVQAFIARLSPTRL